MIETVKFLPKMSKRYKVVAVVDKAQVKVETNLAM